MTSSLWDAAKVHNKNRAVLASAVLAVASIALGIAVPHLAVFGTATTHVAGEVIAAVIAFILGVALISISRSAEQPWLNILGWGFLLVAGLDLVHALFSSPAASSAFGNSDQIASAISLLSRTALGAFALWAALKLEKQADGSFTLSSLRWPIAVVGSLLVGSVAISVLQALDGSTVSPSDRLSLLPGLIFLAAFIVVQRRRSQDTHTLLAFTVFLLASGAADTAFAFHTAEPFDGYFSTLHIYKLFSYGVMLVGLLMESQRLHSFELRARQELGKVNDSLNESNLGLTSASNDLKTLNQIGRIAGISVSVTDRFDQIADLIRTRIDAERVSVAFIDESGTHSRMVVTNGLDIAGRASGTLVPLANTHTGESILNKRTIVVGSSNIDAIRRGNPDMFVNDIKAGVRSWITTPIIIEDSVVGVLMVRSVKSLAYGEREIQFVEQVASQLAGLVRHGRTRQINAA